MEERGKENPTICFTYNLTKKIGELHINCGEENEKKVLFKVSKSVKSGDSIWEDLTVYSLTIFKEGISLFTKMFNSIEDAVEFLEVEVIKEL